MPLPAGRLRFYQRDEDRRMEFIGESGVDHMAKDETVRAYIGNSFDLAGERRCTSTHRNDDNHKADQSFEIKLRNHKKEPVEICVREHIRLGYSTSSGRYNWEIKEDGFKMIDSDTVERLVTLKPDEEKVITYTVNFSW
jgi:hypothetical protein